MTAAMNPSLIPNLVAWHSAGVASTVTKDASNLVSNLDSLIGTYPATATSTARPTLTRSDNLENRVAQSEVFTGTEWDRATYPVTFAAGVMTATAGTAIHAIYSSASPHGSFRAGEAVRQRFDIEYNNNQWATVGNLGDSPWHITNVDLLNGTVSGNTNLTSATISVISGRRYIVTITWTAVADGNLRLGVGLGTAGGQTSFESFTAAGTEKVNIYSISHNTASASSTYLATTTIPQYAGINSKSALLFNGTANVLRCDALSSVFTGTDAAFSTLAVYKLTTTSASNRLLIDSYLAANQDNDYVNLYAEGSASRKADIIKRDHVGTGLTETLTITATRSIVVRSAVCTGTAISAYVNGVSDGSSLQAFDAGAMTSDRLIIGANYYSGVYSGYLPAYLCELLIYNRALTDTERQSIEEYLADQWINTSHTNLLINYPSTVAYGTTAWNCGREPKYIITRGLESMTPNARRPAFTIQLDWDGVSDAQRAAFVSGVLNYADLTPFVIYDTNNYVLDGRGSITARLTSANITPRVTTSAITATFEEVI